MSDQRANDAAVSRIAARQHGVISTDQLVSAGIDKHGVRHRVVAGRLHRVHVRVYAVGHPGLSQEGRWMAAVLTFGATAVLSYRAAAALWRLLSPMSGIVDVTIPGDSGLRRRAGIRLHRSPTLQAVEVTRRRGIPVTKPERTLADLRRVVTATELRAAVRQAAVLGLPLNADVGARGDEIDDTRSELERRFLRLCRRHRLPIPEVNVRVSRFTVDFLWRKEQLIVETDGYRYHRGRQAFEDDRSRDLALKGLGYEVLRITHRQLTDGPSGVMNALRGFLRGA